MTAPLDPATLRALAADLDEERWVELHHAAGHCTCRSGGFHTGRAALLDDLVHRYRSKAIEAELAAKKTTT